MMWFSYCEMLSIDAKNAWGSLDTFFSQMWNKHVCFSWIDHWFLHCYSPMNVIFTQSFLNMKFQLVTLAETTEPCTSLDNLWALLWSPAWVFTLPLYKCWQTGDFWEDSSLPPVFSFGPNGAHCDLEESATFRKFILALSKLIYCKDFVRCWFKITFKNPCVKSVKDQKGLIVEKKLQSKSVNVHYRLLNTKHTKDHVMK